MSGEAQVVERKIMGVLMRAARERSHRSRDQVAQRLGVSRARVRQYELGRREVALPELEILAIYLQMPLSYFVDPDSNIPEEIPLPPQPEEIKSLCTMVGKRLKQARLAASKSRDEAAQAAGITEAALARFERGLGDIPITVLDRLAEFLGVNLFHFLLADHEDQADVLDLEKLALLPKDVRGFALNADNLPYLRMAQKFRDLPHDKQKELGEILLIVR